MSKPEVKGAAIVCTVFASQSLTAFAQSTERCGLKAVASEELRHLERQCRTAAERIKYELEDRAVGVHQG